MKKKKIWSTITRLTFAFMFVASWAVLGVALALKTAKIEIGGGITFTATDVYAKVSGSVTGSKTANPIDEHPIEFDASTSSDFTVDSSWTNMDLNFQDANTPIVMTITIENKSSERSLWAIFDENISVDNLNLARTADGSSVDSFSVIEIPAKTTNTTSSKTLTITMSINDKSTSVSDTFNFSVTLTSEAILDESAYPTLSFDYTSLSGGVRVSPNPSNPPSGDLVIPSRVLHNGEMYTVTGICILYSDALPFSNVSSVYIPASINIFSSNGIPYALFGNLTSAVFENPNGWSYFHYNSGDSYDEDLSPSRLSNPVTAASILNGVYWEDYLSRS